MQCDVLVTIFLTKSSLSQVWYLSSFPVFSILISVFHCMQ